MRYADQCETAAELAKIIGAGWEDPAHARWGYDDVAAAVTVRCWVEEDRVHLHLDIMPDVAARVLAVLKED